MLSSEALRGSCCEGLGGVERRSDFTMGSDANSMREEQQGGVGDRPLTSRARPFPRAADLSGMKSLIPKESAKLFA